ncbi:MAG TPA: hypothetical protein VEA63_11265, partial [Opitutus sp.]|nr:hypothetical protein [Opitutus sp.]
MNTDSIRRVEPRMDTNGHEWGGKRRWKTVVAVWGALAVWVGVVAEPVKVELLEWAPGRFELLRAGEPYVVRGAGGEDLKSLAAAGANSVRTWGAEGIDGLLDEAQRLGLTVTVGIWVEHERHGFD